ncbi:glycyl-radical enzyme activating protein, partial [Gemmatimonadota bacterium]
FAIHDGPGLRTTVFFKGCPLACWACHNPEGKEKRKDLFIREERCTLCGDCLEVCEPGSISLDGGKLQVDRSTCTSCGLCIDVCLPGALTIAGREVTVREVLKEIERDVVFYDQSGGGVTFSGGEPLSQPDFLLELMNECRERDISIVVDTSGYAPRELVESVAEHTDLFLYDLKLVDGQRHENFTGASNELILENLTWLSANSHRVVVRVPLFSGINDDEENIAALGTFVAGLPNKHTIDLLPYHCTGIDKYRRLDHAYKMGDVRPPSEEAIGAVVRSLQAFGLTVSVRGNSNDN